MSEKLERQKQQLKAPIQNSEKKPLYPKSNQPNKPKKPKKPMWMLLPPPPPPRTPPSDNILTFVKRRVLGRPTSAVVRQRQERRDERRERYKMRFIKTMVRNELDQKVLPHVENKRKMRLDLLNIFSKDTIPSPTSFDLSWDTYTSLLPYVKKIATWVVKYKLSQAGIPENAVCKGRLTKREQTKISKRLESRSRYGLFVDLWWLISHIRFTQPKTKAELKKSPNTTKKTKARIYQYKNLASYPLADWVLRRYYKCKWTPPPSNSTSSKSTKSVRTYLNLRSFGFRKKEK